MAGRTAIPDHDILDQLVEVSLLGRSDAPPWDGHLPVEVCDRLDLAAAILARVFDLDECGAIEDAHPNATCCLRPEHPGRHQRQKRALDAWERAAGAATGTVHVARLGSRRLRCDEALCAPFVPATTS